MITISKTNAKAYLKFLQAEEHAAFLRIKDEKEKIKSLRQAIRITNIEISQEEHKKKKR